MEQHTINGAASNLQSLANDKYRQATTAVDQYVSHNPWKTIGLVAAIGVLIGFLTAKH